MVHHRAGCGVRAKSKHGGEIHPKLLTYLQDIFEHCQVFLELSLHLFFENILTELHHIGEVCLHGQFDLGIAFGDLECEGGKGLQWTGKGLEAIARARFVFRYFECGLYPQPHEVADALKTRPRSKDLSGQPCRCQSPILPLEIVLGCADKFEDTFNRLADERA